jgi:hypothetical protein
MAAPPPPYDTREPGRIGTARVPCLTNAIRLCDLKELMVCSYVHSSEDLVVEVRICICVGIKVIRPLWSLANTLSLNFLASIGLCDELISTSRHTHNGAMQAHRKAITDHGLASCWRGLTSSRHKLYTGWFFGHLSNKCSMSLFFAQSDSNLVPGCPGNAQSPSLPSTSHSLADPR